jgi:hypothetical protein
MAASMTCFAWAAVTLATGAACMADTSIPSEPTAPWRTALADDKGSRARRDSVSFIFLFYFLKMELLPLKSKFLLMGNNDSWDIVPPKA